jgi:hypothetical protein
LEGSWPASDSEPAHSQGLFSADELGVAGPISSSFSQAWPSSCSSSLTLSSLQTYLQSRQRTNVSTGSAGSSSPPLSASSPLVSPSLGLPQKDGKHLVSHATHCCDVKLTTGRRSRTTCPLSRPRRHLQPLVTPAGASHRLPTHHQDVTLHPSAWPHQLHLCLLLLPVSVGLWVGIYHDHLLPELQGTFAVTKFDSHLAYYHRRDWRSRKSSHMSDKGIGLMNQTAVMFLAPRVRTPHLLGIGAGLTAYVHTA